MKGVSHADSVPYILTPARVPLRADIAGGWLDVPRFSIDGAYVVNCAINAMVSLTDWPYQREGGLGGSAAWSALNPRNSVDSELADGVGWQDPAVIAETGLCVWRSGTKPQLAFKSDGDFLAGRMALKFIGKRKNTHHIVDKERDYPAIAEASKCAAEGVREGCVYKIMRAVMQSADIQVKEGMKKLPEIQSAVGKYCGKGFGGYAVYIFHHPKWRDEALKKTKGLIPVEPYLKAVWN